MISVTLSQLTDILNGELQGADITLDAVTTDTRKLDAGLPVCCPERRTFRCS
ncbi:UDP-N-acetylmuramoyl-tripeptide--D-alanyl-D-ala ni ne ligase [Escherichia coli]|uniref:UDP-N-acetylmuramoyl-tripeptide--D-alanyl-D-ala ni ne ligase n=1 Tax=Escherichia coli TaxID=562 RepID=A0A376MQS0_ECOLX|nr:UDP-N-acetylmuramoyl-tripeptide--D-alanyl-D-ala ni ne ligase [Escherichia coli]